MSEEIIQVEGLTKVYGDLVAVDRISFNVNRGEIFSLVGPNGAGKTTTVEVLECLRSPTSGSVRVFGYDVEEEERKVKEKIGVMPQDFNTFENLTVRENVDLIANISGKDGGLDELLDELGLSEDVDRKFKELSGGMKRRVGLAMALANDPELAFLDEPTTGLDPQARRNLWQTIKELRRRNVTILLTTHYMDEVEELSDRVGIILDGKILSIDKLDKLITDYGGKAKIVVKGGNVAGEILRKYSEDVFSEDEGEFVAFFEDKKTAAKAHYFLYENLSGKFEVTLEQPSMEDVFLNVAGGRVDEKGVLIE